MGHVPDKHENHPDALFPKCAHGELETPRHWIKIGLLFYFYFLFYDL